MHSGLKNFMFLRRRTLDRGVAYDKPRMQTCGERGHLLAAGANKSYTFGVTA